MKPIGQLSLLMLLASLSGCFSVTDTECDFRGGLKVIHNKALFPSVMQHATFDMAVYTARETQSFTAVGDTLLSDIPTGVCDIFSVVSGGENYLRNGTSRNAMEICMPVNNVAGRSTLVGRSLPLFVSTTTETVPVNDQITALMLYALVTKQVNWKIEVVRTGSAANVDVSSCSAELSGVSTGYRVAQREITQEESTLLINPRTTDNRFFLHQTHLFGFLPQNMLTMQVSLVDGYKRTANIDLSNVFRNLSGDVITIELRVTIDSTFMSVEIISVSIHDWEPGEYTEHTIR